MKKKVLVLLIALISIVMCALGIAACELSDAHSHNWNYTSNGISTHIGRCDCGESRVGAHNFINGYCRLCGYYNTAADNNAQTVEATSIYLNKNSLSLNVGNAETLTATILPSNAADKTVNWVSTNLDVATVENGKVTGISEGTANIVASTSNGKTAECTLTVIENTHGLIFKEYKDGYAVIGYNGSDTSVTVPSAYKSKPVLAIGDGLWGGFRYCKSLISITLPDSLKEINYSAFSDCSSLTSLSIPENVTVIDEYAFSNCTSLKKLIISQNVKEIGEYALCGCNNLEELTLPFIGKTSNGYVKTFLRDLFGFSSYATVGIPQNLKSIIVTGGTVIDDYAFYGCKELTSITLADSLTSIGESAFEGCSGLKSISLSRNIVEIGEYAFSACSGLESIAVSKGNLYYHSTNNCLIETASNTLILGCKNSIIPNDGSVTTIRSYAFSECNGLTSITVPDSIVSIESFSFYGCTGLESITLPFVGAGENATKPYEMVFGHIFGSTTTTKAMDVAGTTLQASSVINSKTYYFHFYIPDSLKQVTIGNTITNIKSLTFTNCKNIEEIILGNSLTRIERKAFNNCQNLKRISIPSTVTYIGESILYGCGNLENIEFPYVIGNYTFGYLFGEDFYSNSISVKQYRLTNESTNTGVEYTYYIPFKLKNVVITSGNIAYGAFRSCKMIETVSFSNVESINEGAFYECSNIKSLNISDTVTYIDSYAFRECSGIESISVSKNNQAYHSSGNCLIETTTKTLVLGCKNSVIPIDGSVTIIGNSAFFGCSYLDELIIPKYVTQVSSYAFYGCNSLEKVYYGGTYSDWQKININSSYNSSLTNASRYYYSENEPTDSNNYWHYDIDGITPVIWI